MKLPRPFVVIPSPPQRTRNLLFLLLAALFALAGASAQKEKEKKGDSATFGEDRGRFHVVVDGQPSGTEEFQITRSGSEWTASGEVQIPAEGGVSKLSGKLRFSVDGSPIRYEYDWTPHGGKKVAANVTFNEGLARVETQMQGTTSFVQEFKFDTPRILILDNNLFHQYALLGLLYDWEQKGSQTIPVLIPQDQTPGNITVDWVGPQAVEGQKLDQLRVHSADLEIDVYFDSARRLMRVAVPSSKAEVIREPAK